MQHSNTPPIPSEEHTKLLKYLDEFDRQLSSRRNAPSGLEEQLASVSRAYSQAQEKLLETERALMTESVLLEKQRSVIDIYKCVLSEQLDEQGLLYFLQRLEEDEANRQIYDDIAQLRAILARTRNKTTDHQRMKAELTRAAQEQSFLTEQAENANTSCLEAQMQSEQLQDELQAVRDELDRQRTAWQQTSNELAEERRANQQLTQQLSLQTRTLEEYSLREKELLGDRERLHQMERVILSKLGCEPTLQDKENSLTLANKGKMKGMMVMGELEGRLSQLAKYKTQYRKLKDQQTSSDFLQREVTLLKLFLSQEALQLFRQLEEQRQESIQGELRNLALLERSRIIKLQQCEQDVWKYRLQLLQEQEDTTRKIDPRQTSAVLARSLQLDPVSEFEA